MLDDALNRDRRTEIVEGPPHDAELLRHYADTRAEDAFAELVRRHLDGVYSAALRRVGGDTHLAQDVAQQVFVALARKAAAVAQHPVLSGWLYITTRNEAANVVRHERRRKTREQEANVMHDVLLNQPGEADWNRVAPLLDAVIDELNEAERTVVLLRFVERRPFAEIGATLRLSEDAARMRVERALDKLRALLARRGIGSTSAALGAALAHHAVVAAPASLAATIMGSALTSATLASGPVAAAFQFMITSKIATGAALVVLAVALGTVTRESRARQAATSTLDARTAELAQLETRLRDSEQRAVLAEKTLNDVRAALAANETQPTKSPEPSGAAAPGDPIAAGREFLAQHPEAQALWDERDRANIAAKFGPIFRMLDLSAAQQEQFATLALRSISGMTIVAGPTGNITLRREPSLTREESETQLQELIGREKYARFQQLAQLGPTFDLTIKLASALYRTEPMRPEQTERVMQIFAEASPVGKSGPRSGPAGIDWGDIRTKASSVLSPGQLAALEGVQRNFEYQQAVQKISRGGVDSPAPKSATPPSR